MAKRLKNNLVFFGAKTLFALVNMLPRWLTLWMGERLGNLAWCVVKKERVRSLENLERAFGESRTITERAAISRACFITFGRATIEAMRLRKHYHRQIRPCIEVVGEEHFRAVYDRGKGIVAFTGHFGNFELLAAHTAQSGYKCAAIGRELYDKRLDRMLTANREAMGLINIRTDDSPKSILRLLKEGYVIGFLIDTDSQRVAGEFVPFFGRPARTPTGPAQLGLMAQAAFVPAFCLSFPNGKYRIVMGPELIPESYDRTPDNVAGLTAQMTQVIENTIRANPEQWIWMHPRWRSKPS